jgi:hypothetical protein
MMKFGGALTIVPSERSELTVCDQPDESSAGSKRRVNTL